MCQKRQRRCPALLAIREEAFEEWTRAETFEEVCRVWARLGGRVTLHRDAGEGLQGPLLMARRARAPPRRRFQPGRRFTNY
jgi:hypothetical protein